MAAQHTEVRVAGEDGPPGRSGPMRTCRRHASTVALVIGLVSLLHASPASAANR